MTVASLRSVLNRSCSRNLTRFSTPARRAFSAAWRFRRQSSSTPKPRAPNFFAAVTTMRPSPEPRSTTTSCGPTLAIRSISSTVTCGVATYGAASLGGPSGSCPDAGPTAKRASSTRNEKAIFTVTSSLPHLPLSAFVAHAQDPRPAPLGGAGIAPRTRANRAFHQQRPLDPALEVKTHAVVHQHESDAVAVEPCFKGGQIAAGHARAAPYLLVLLLQLEFELALPGRQARGEPPPARNRRGHHVQHVGLRDDHPPVRLPALEAVIVRDDARPRLELGE